MKGWPWIGGVNAASGFRRARRRWRSPRFEYLEARLAPALTLGLSTLTGTVGTLYSQQVSVTGGSAGDTLSYSLNTAQGDPPNNGLPPGLSLSATTGLLSGTPTAPGPYDIVVDVTDNTSGATGEEAFPLSISPLITLSGGVANLMEYAPATGDVITATGPPGDTYTFATSGNVPPGLSLVDTSATTAQLEGNSNEYGTFSFLVTATDTRGYTGSQPYQMTILPDISFSPTPFANAETDGGTVIDFPNVLPSAVVGHPYIETIVGSSSNGVASITYNTNQGGALPAGLNVTTTSNMLTISGTPTAFTQESAPVHFNLTGKDLNGNTAGVTYELDVEANNPSPYVAIEAQQGSTLYSDVSLPDGVLGQAYPTTTFTTPAGSGSYTFAVMAPLSSTTGNGSVPPGMTFNTTTATLSGTPTQSGLYNLVIQATNATTGVTDSSVFRFTVDAPASGLALGPATIPLGFPDTPYSQQITATGGTGTTTLSYSFASGSQATLTEIGLAISQPQSNELVISGTPSQTSLATVTPLTIQVTATDSAAHTAVVEYPISIYFSPQQISQAYALNTITLAGGISGNGAGQTVAIVTNGDAPNLISTSDPNFANSDLHQFDLALGLPDPPSFSKLNEFGGNDLPAVNSSTAHETTQDVEWVHALAPQAKIILLESGVNLFDALQTARTLPGVTVVSMSYSIFFDLNSFNSNTFAETTIDSLFTSPAGHPMTFVISAGDARSSISAGSYLNHYPEISPNVLAVGYTSLTLNAQGGIASQPAVAAAGGGASVQELQPSYQQGVVSTVSTTMRTSPDVTLNGQLAGSEVAVYDSMQDGNGIPWTYGDGTSISAPSWAAILAMLDQAEVAAGRAPLDGPTQTLPDLYSLAGTSAFLPVTVRTDGTVISSSFGSYNPYGGLGSPVVSQLIADLAPTHNPVYSALSTPTITYGTAMTTLSGQVGAGALIPTGSVSITLNGVTVMAPINPTTGAFSASFNTAALGVAASPYTISFSYPGDASFVAGSSTSMLTVSPATPTVTWAKPAAITYGTVLGAAQLDASASVAGTFTYTPPAGTLLSAGQGQALSVLFTPSDAADYTTAQGSTTINVGLAAPAFSALSAPSITYGTTVTTLSGQIAATGSVIPPGSVSITLDGVTAMPSIEAGSGDFFSVFNTAALGVAASPYTISYSFAGNANFSPASSTSKLTVGKATPTVSWVQPANIVTGTALGSAQLDATASVAGSFTYTPPAGTVLPLGVGQSLSVSFNPTDSADYNNAQGATTINVVTSSPTPTPTPTFSGLSAPSITFGTATTTLAGQIGAGALIPSGSVAIILDGVMASATINATTGAFSSSFNTAALGVGASPYTIFYSFAGNANFEPASATTALTVSRATPTITWANPASITYGAALGSAQLDATASVPGTFDYTPGAGTVLNAGQGHILSVTFNPTDSTDYKAVGTTAEINVLKATPTVTWANPPDITYGTSLGPAQLDASASVAGNFVYTPGIGSVLNAGPGQTLSVTFSPNDSTDYNPATATATINILKATPTVTWANPADITYGTALGPAQLDASASLGGTFVYTPGTGSVLNGGPGQTLSVTFNPTDSTDYNSVNKTVTINVLKAKPTVTWANPPDITYGTALGSAELDATTTVAGTFEYTPASGAVLNAGLAQTLSVAFNPTDSTDYNAVMATAKINVQKATPTINWANPSDITYGTPLGSTQLDATASVGGTFVYAPATGIVLGAGAGQTLSLTFNPDDSTDYTAVTATAKINVLKAAPTITWANPPDITYGTALGSSQLDATASVPGTFTYSPASGVVLHAGQGQSLSVAFSPTDTSDYNPATATATINVQKATATVTWANPADITYGTALGPDQLDATATVPGTFDYTPASGAVLHAGLAQTLSVAFTPTDATDYNAVMATATINVQKATATLTWASPADITYGIPLGSGQLDATSSTPGSFVYTPAAGTVLSAGLNQPLSVTFTPSDAADFSGATANVSINVAPAPLAIAVMTATKVYGQPNPAFTVQYDSLENGDTPADLTGSLTFNTTATATSDVGTYDVNVSGLSSDNYAITYVKGALTITPASQTIAWSAPADITYGTPLGATQLNATVSVAGPAVAGALTYDPASGKVLGAGAGQTLSVTAAATLDYSQATASVPINVLQATPVLAWPAPAGITFGTALGSAQLDASASFGGQALTGAFSYSQPVGTVLDVGNGQTLSVLFTPEDTTDFTTASLATTIDVTPATPVFDSLAAPDLTYGTSATTLSGHIAAGSVVPPGDVSIMLDGTTETAAIDSSTGSFSVSFPTAALGASATPYTIAYSSAGSTDFAPASATSNLTVNKADQTIHWSNPADIVYGTPLSATQLDATISVPGPDSTTGGLTYSSPNGTVLHAGSAQMLTATAAATANYNAASMSVTINVAKATPTVTWTNPADIVYGTPLGAAQLDASASAAGSFTYQAAAGSFLNAGQGQPLNATFVPADATDFNPVPVNAQINVTPAPLTITANAGTIAAGQALPSFTAQYAGFVRGEGPGVLDGTLSFTVPPGAADQAGAYPIIPAGLSAANYAITYSPGTLTVTQPGSSGTQQSPAGPLVTVKSVGFTTEKLSHHKSVKVLVVTFSAALNQADAQNVAAYQLAAAGKATKRGTKTEKPVKLASAAYSSSALTVTLTPKATLPNQTLQLTITGSQILDSQGRSIDGARDGQSGSNFVEPVGK